MHENTNDKKMRKIQIGYSLTNILYVLAIKKFVV